MSGKIKYLLYRDGRYFARLVIPVKLRPYFDGRTELRQALGADRRSATRMHPVALAELMHQIALAERKLAEVSGAQVTPGRYPLSLGQIAMRSYQARLRQDEDARNFSPDYAGVGIDDGYAAKLRDGIAGKLRDKDLEALVGHRITHFQLLGNTTAAYGSTEWRDLARAICISEYEALARVFERDDGDFSGQPEHPLLRNAEPEELPLPPVSLRGLFADYIASRNQLGRGRESERRWSPVIKHLHKHLGHDDARRISKQDLMAWRDNLMQRLSPKTVNDVYLAAIRTIFSWAVREDRLPENPATAVRQEVPKKVKTRPKGFTLEEAERVLTFSVSYFPKPLAGRASTEFPETTAAKRWIPLLCAFTGARVTEMSQLRKEDVFQEGGINVIKITPDAGTVKTDEYRDVPLHRQIVELGFLDFVAQAASGPLFYRTKDGTQSLSGARMTSGRVSDWLRASGLVPAKVAPNHAWRHRFRTVAMELGLSDRIIDAVSGHAVLKQRAADGYGHATLKAMARLVDALPSYSIAGHVAASDKPQHAANGPLTEEN
ncbi:tyrosine-type recombinase/integrase [Puniceibacterium confluentis]|uniref:tyrosine-type recombinase/integrase n=1 Tax=Puniceibacterium confluentis TaxID=1958944 RepID=UPI0016452277|nr:tyrosine-type recombinase/integrase [Puniceibacterium confluentis]